MPPKSSKFINSRSLVAARIKELGVLATEAREDESKLTALKIRYRSLQNWKADFEKNHDLILASLEDNTEIEGQDAIRKEVDEAYFLIEEVYYELVESLTPSPAVSTPSTSAEPKSNVKLPRINLPIFSGQLKDWNGWVDLFNCLIHNNQSLSDMEKFSYMMTSLSKEAQNVIKSIKLTSDNYIIAYQALIKRYQNRRLLATHYWNAINDSPPLANDNLTGIRKLVDTFEENLASLEHLEFPVHSWNFILFNLMLNKLDNETRKHFELQFKSSEIPSYNNLKEFLINHCKALASCELDSVSQKTKVQKPYNLRAIQGGNKFRASTNTLVVNTSTSTPTSTKCAMCKSVEHSLVSCPTFLQKQPNERFAVAKQHNLCINCLRSSHKSSSCTSKYVCRNCKAKHHTLLHFSRENSDNQASSSSSRNENLPTTSVDPPQNVNVLTNTIKNVTVLLATAVIEVRDSTGNFQPVRILLDSASQANFITTDCCNRLGLVANDLSIPIHGLSSMSPTTSKGVTLCTIKPRQRSNPQYDIEAFILDRVCAPMPSTFIAPRDWKHLVNINLADPQFNVPKCIDILIGASTFPLILRPGRRMGGEKEPVAINTVFGYILMGEVTCQSQSQPINALCVSTESYCDNALKQFWTVEEVPQVSNILSPEEETCEMIYKKTVSRHQSGRFIVALPFKTSTPSLGDSYSLALRRLLTLERRLENLPETRMAYVDYMRTMLLTGHIMEPIESSQRDNGIKYYIPHHYVLKPQSTSTKLRVVFDASMKTTSGMSLNDNLLIGPKLQRDIGSILLHFRLHAVAFSCDIKQMYLQVFVTPEHRDFQRILWRFSSEEPIQEFRLNTVTFGVSSSPYLAIRTLHQLADSEVDFPLASHVLKTDTYVDDIVTGSDSLQSALVLKDQLISLLGKGGFSLRKWSSNNKEFCSSLPENHQHDPLSFDSDSTVKVLGLQWQPSGDIFSFSVSPINRGVTKRTILSELARVFDPLGYLTPVTLFAKHLIQRLWALGLDWDEAPPPFIRGQWDQYLNELEHISHIKIPRFVDTKSSVSCQMHGYCDASEIGYAGVVYFRLINSDGSIKTHLIAAKSKVAPLKSLSIPRLELCAAVLLAKLMEFITNVYAEKIHFDKIYAYTDSMVTLNWIQSSPHRWKTFISNRTAYILDRVPPSCWRHIESTHNPADCASRGLMPKDLLQQSQWWAGPQYLLFPENNWTHIGTDTELPAGIDIEERKTVLVLQVNENFVIHLLNKYSSLAKIQRIVAYCLRFMSNCRQRNTTKALDAFTSAELYEALIYIVRVVQHQEFSKEINSLMNQEKCVKSLQRLSPFLDNKNLIRVGGRLRHSELPFDIKHPILLPRLHRLTTLIIEQFHKEHLHPGRQTLHFLISQQFWILSGRRAINHCLSRCLRCFRANPTSMQPLMGDLPKFRITQVKAFSHSGVDFAGPYNITLAKHRGAKTYKAYICLFVCCAVKAVHLELVSDLSSDAFLAAFRRFVARRGRCSDLYSDCGTNFVGANRQLALFAQSSAAHLAIKWHFNPPASPHFGGIWERGVRSVKTHLSRVVGIQTMTYEEFNTLLIQIEAVLNSRPLFAASTDPNDLSVLTPSHFLMLEPVTSPPDEELTDVKLNRLSRWQLIQRCQQDFWRRWHREYLHTLQQRSKWTRPIKNIAIGQLVLIKQPNTPPLQWPLGRIVKVHPGADKIIRVVTLRTSNGLMQRPVIKLCPLPCE